MPPFILNYQGSKYRETKHLAHLNFSSYDTIVEVFGGSFGFTRYLYYELGIKDKRFVVYDNNPEIVRLYNAIKEGHFDLKEYHALCDEIFERFKTGKDKSQVRCKEAAAWIKDNVESEPHRMCLLLNLQGAPISRVYWKKELDVELFQRIEFIDADCATIKFNTLYDKETTLYYIDPPYLFECNGWYKETDQACFQVVLDLMLKGNHALLVHSHNVVLHHILKDHFLFDYDKVYKNKGKRVVHSVYASQKEKLVIEK